MTSTNGVLFKLKDEATLTGVNKVMNGGVLNLGRWESPCSSSSCCSITEQKGVTWSSDSPLIWGRNICRKQNHLRAMLAGKERPSRPDAPGKGFSEMFCWSKSRWQRRFCYEPEHLSSVNRKNVQQGAWELLPFQYLHRSLPERWMPVI